MFNSLIFVKSNELYFEKHIEIFVFYNVVQSYALLLDLTQIRMDDGSTHLELFDKLLVFLDYITIL